MFDFFVSYVEQMQQMPLWFRLWSVFLMLMNAASLTFVFTRPATRMVLFAFVAVIVMAMGIFVLQGQEMTRAIGFAHAIGWTPLLWYLWRRRGDIFLTHTSGVYLHLLFITNAISLIFFDYINIVRFLMGDGSYG